MKRTILIGFIAIILTACTQSANTKAAENEVTRFHAEMAGKDSAQIYSRADPQLQAVTSADQFNKLIDAVATKLGPVKESKLQSWRVNVGTGGSTVILAYDTQFTKGKGQETFVYSSGEAPKLIGYNINSNDMLVN